MKVCVTGGAGFIGSHTVDLLISEGHSVFVIDDLSTGRKENVNEKALFYELSVIDPDLKKIFETEKPDVVMHLAAQSSVRVSIKDPKKDTDTNILGTYNLMEACVGAGVKKIVYSTTGGALYGDPEKFPSDETHKIKPLCPYGISKFAGEMVIEMYGSLYDIGYTTLRYSNVYGPRQDPHGEAGVIAIFYNQMKKGEVPVIFGDGEQSRDFVYVEDVARANLKALESNPLNDAVNISSCESFSVNQVYSLMKEISGLDIGAKHGDEVPGEVRKMVLNYAKAKEKLGWIPRIEFKEGLQKSWDWIKDN